ncbi:MAG: hypothetical protein EB168_05995, partial [Euryarchaeota archaeon]|nr:hypothetical protein [Euryarchaeota archaeon]
MAPKTDKLDTAELQSDFGGITGIGIILAKDEDGRYLNPELIVMAYRSQGWENAKISPNGKRVIKGKKS